MDLLLTEQMDERLWNLLYLWKVGKSRELMLIYTNVITLEQK